MTTTLSPETPIAELATSIELLDFAIANNFTTIKELLSPGFNGLRQYEGFDYRLQREIVEIVQSNHWERLLEED